MQGGVWQEVVWDIKCNANCRRIQDTFGLRVNASIVKAPCRGSGCSGDRDKSNDVLLRVNQIQSSSCCEGQPQAGAGKAFQCLNYFSYTCQKNGTASNTWYQGFGTMLSRDFIHYCFVHHPIIEHKEIGDFHFHSAQWQPFLAAWKNCDTHSCQATTFESTHAPHICLRPRQNP